MSGNNTTSTDVSTPSLLNRIKFGIFVSFQIPSFICSIYLFSRYAQRRNVRQSIHNHVVIVLLISSFIFVCCPLSASESFFFTSYVRPSSHLFCALWTWVHYSTNIGNLILMTFACCERHWLVFRLNPMHRKRTRIIYHYIPIAACIVYPWLFYFVLIFLYPCEPLYDYRQLLCIMPCYFVTEVIGKFDTFLNNWVPIFSIPVLSAALFIRFLAQKRERRIEIFRWKRDRKMVIQMLSITLLYVLTWGILQAVVVYSHFANGRKPFQFEIDYLYMLPYFVHLFYPFVVLLSSSELRRRD